MKSARKHVSAHSGTRSSSVVKSEWLRRDGSILRSDLGSIFGNRAVIHVHRLSNLARRARCSVGGIGSGHEGQFLRNLGDARRFHDSLERLRSLENRSVGVDGGDDFNLIGTRVNLHRVDAFNVSAVQKSTASPASLVPEI